MIQRSQIYGREATSLLRDITLYHHLYRQQLLRMYPGKEDKILKVLSHLTHTGRIQYDHSRDLYHDHTDEPINRARLAALWVLTDLIDRVEYHSSTDFPAQLVFLANGELYEVIAIPSGKETLITQALSTAKDTGDHRIVILDSTSQLPLLHIPKTIAYCTVTQDGAIHYFKEEST